MSWFRVLRTAGVPILAAIVLIALLGIWSGSRPEPQGGVLSLPDTAVSDTTRDGDPIWSDGASNAQHHWEKHGSEFPEFATADAYIAGAHAFIDHPPPGTLTKARDNGDTLFYNPDSNTFAVRASNGAPRTFFRPDSGMAYWKRQ